MSNPFDIVRDFEAAVCEYTGAPYCVTTNSCTMALLLAVAWHLQQARRSICWGEAPAIALDREKGTGVPLIEIPKRTYCSVPMSIIHAGGRPVFRDEEWRGDYQLKPLPVWDSARWFYRGMYRRTAADIRKEGGLYSRWDQTRDMSGRMLCVSFHASKTLGDTQGGAILHDDPHAYAWLRRARFDGRTEGVAPKDDKFTQIGWHCYMSPDVAARLLWKLQRLPRHNEPLPNDDYPDLSTMEIFK